MATTTKKKGDTRIELRLSQQDKEFFEYACSLRGFRSFSEFARLAIQKEARSIVDEAKTILASKRDQEIFFQALMGKEEKPNKALIAAFRDHNQMAKK